MTHSPSLGARIGECRCGNALYLRGGAPIEKYMGNVLCDECRSVVYDDQPQGPGKALPVFFGHAGGK